MKRKALTILPTKGGVHNTSLITVHILEPLGVELLGHLHCTMSCWDSHISGSLGQEAVDEDAIQDGTEHPWRRQIADPYPVTFQANWD